MSDIVLTLGWIGVFLFAAIVAAIVYVLWGAVQKTREENYDRRLERERMREERRR